MTDELALLDATAQAELVRTGQVTGGTCRHLILKIRNIAGARRWVTTRSSGQARHGTGSR